MEKFQTEQIFGNEIMRNSKEFQMDYLQRIGNLVTERMQKDTALFDPPRAKEETLPTDVLDLIKQSMTEALSEKETEIDPIKNEETIRRTKEDFDFHNKGTFTDSDSFDTTQRNRKFFEIQPGKGSAKRETYWNTLFFPYNTADTRAFAKKILDNKKIILLGGGRSRIKEEFEKYGITPSDLVNVDPFVENPEEGSDPVIPLSASQKDFIEKMREQGIESADEIWAEYSVPAYLENPEEIKQLIKNIEALLSPGGTARIWPIQVPGSEEESEQLVRKNALIEALRDLSSKNSYHMTLYEASGRKGIALYKPLFVD